MKAAVFDSLGQPLRVTDVDTPEAGPGQVLLKVCRCGICGSDLHMTEDPTFGLQGGEVIGHEFSGEVIDVGRGVRHLKPGDHVAAAPLRGCGTCPACQRGEPAWCSRFELIGGGYAEYAALDEFQCRKLPWGITVTDGALAEPLAVALHGVLRAGLQPGARVLVVGAGAIGLAVAFWARRMGAAQVVVADLHEHQRDRAMDLGATDFILSGDDMAARTAEACGGTAPEIVFECVGKAGLIDHCIDLAAPRGKVVVLGLCTAPDHLDSFRAISKEVTIVMSVFFTMPEFETAIRALDGGTYAPQHLVSSQVPLLDMPDAFEALRTRTTQCKILVDPTRTTAGAQAR
ncbi:(R,R)-butanediol dehydrogenase / meso-butanediol dehydrogenase / diacetyl reductase [Pseudooceanicola antarcticus]|uniref:(R,R)-butanediol dehydrogenase / meso-butanediol dehydrogenase / diacetyl reductase n=1 Tax=Pseudooceanicola antarcticus TaxID=1247613 RepID=A0A285IJ61_9RHOB|nr:alcohol dehydrogenase catalytic domain-containing protein [Pseudooceanicola antarcticus]PJE28851.1 Zn-dependent alcohol dehydrogenase [Pseudooceanicola antarcticus]SNY48008.1 (R,R)-butanediol dehydrogenase / meso-butanediol dehydrogenase / diacetyl reductase [Pseudooceanicola antarcticus]